MKQFYSLLLIIVMALVALPAKGAFIVRSVKGNVTLCKGGKDTPLKAGMKLTPADNINIPPGGKLEVTNDVNHYIYTSTHEGSFTLSRMMFDATVTADSNISTINSRLKVGGAGVDKGNRVYVEKGMVKRSLSEYDPQASGFTIDPATLARCIVERGEGSIVKNDTPFDSSLERGEDGSLTISMTNKEEFPIYFNIISSDSEGGYSLSCLGQPAGSYILLPRQGIMRNHPDPVDPAQKQLLIVANCSFDVDMLLEELNKPAEHNPDPIPEFPLYLLYF